MRAVGFHILIQRPKKITETEAGIIVPHNAEMPSYYGRVIAVGGKVEEVAPGDILVYANYGANPVEFDAWSRDQAANQEGFVVVAESMAYAVISEEWARSKGLRIDEIQRAEAVSAT